MPSDFYTGEVDARQLIRALASPQEETLISSREILTAISRTLKGPEGIARLFVNDLLACKSGSATRMRALLDLLKAIQNYGVSEDPNTSEWTVEDLQAQGAALIQQFFFPVMIEEGVSEELLRRVEQRLIERMSDGAIEGEVVE